MKAYYFRNDMISIPWTIKLTFYKLKNIIRLYTNQYNGRFKNFKRNLNNLMGQFKLIKMLDYEFHTNVMIAYAVTANLKMSVK